MPESLEICSFLIAKGTNWWYLVPPVGVMYKKLPIISSIKTRLTNMPVSDWANEKDMSYHLWKHKKKGGIIEYEAAEDTAAIVDLNAKLAQVPALLHGGKCLNKWGLGMDNVLFLPWLRHLTCIKGVEFPDAVKEYMVTVGAQVEDYSKHAV